VTRGRIDLKVVTDRASAIRRMIAQLRALPCASIEEFTSDFRTPAAAESLLRRAIEALMDIARHLLAKGHGIGTLEYREIARVASERGLVTDAALSSRFVEIAGFRNRLTHFYNEVTPGELRDILVQRIDDLERVTAELEAAATRLAPDA